MSYSNWSNVERLFHAALERPFEQREAYLSVSANSPEELKAVKELLDAAEMAEDFMQTSMGLGAFSPSLQKGQILGAWTILENIGSGGMGEIYRVKRQAENFEQIAALKITRTKDRKYLKQFQAERRILAQLEHPNIGRFIDGGSGPLDDPYFAMELVTGSPITQHCEMNELDQDQRLRLFKQLCDALSHAHSRLILHRDIKPSNVLVTETGQVKLIDFGTSDVLDANEPNRTPITRAYASPEQLKGERLTTATDIFSLGCVLHQMIMGKRLKMDRSLDVDMPYDLKAIIEKCVSEVPDRRYASVDALKDDITNFQNSLPVTARQGGALYRLRRAISRNKLAYGATTLLAASLVAGLVGTFTQMQRAQTAFERSEAAKLEQEFEARTLSGYAYGLQSLYGSSGQGDAAIPAEKIDANMIALAETVKARFDGRSIDDAFLLYSMSQVMANRFDFESSARFLSPLMSLSVTDDLSRDLLFEARSDLARAMIETGNNDEAEMLIRQNLSEREAAGIQFDLGHVQDARGLATLTGGAEEQNRAKEISLKTLEKWEAEGADPHDVSWLYNQLGSSYLERDEIPEAVDAFEKAFESRRQIRVKALDDIRSATNLAQIQIYLNRDGESPLAYLSDYLDPALNEFGAPHIYAFIQGLQSEAASLNQDWELAESKARDGLSYLSENRSYRDGWYYRMIVMQVRALIQLGRVDEAREVFEDAQNKYGAEIDSADWGFTGCRMKTIGGYLLYFEGQKAAGKNAFSNGVQSCREASKQGWDEEKVMPHWVDGLQNEMN